MFTCQSRDFLICHFFFTHFLWGLFLAQRTELGSLSVVLYLDAISFLSSFEEPRIESLLCNPRWRRSEFREGLFCKINVEVSEPIEEWQCTMGSSIICEMLVRPMLYL